MGKKKEKIKQIKTWEHAYVNHIAWVRHEEGVQMNLADMVIDNSIILGEDLMNATLHNCMFRNCTFIGTMTEVDMDKCVFKNCKMNVVFDHCILTSIDLGKSNNIDEKTTFRNCNMGNANLNSNVIKAANFENCFNLDGLINELSSLIEKLKKGHNTKEV